MNTRTAWVAPPATSGGQDHLGTQAPCVLVYAELLPGITNVTDRARYFSFYPWLVWSYRQRFADGDQKHFIEMFRRADCLFTLIAARHDPNGSEPERHGAATTGTQTLNGVARRLLPGDVIELDTYATTDDKSPERYFKNSLGGLGQYYSGTLMNLELLDGAKFPSTEPFGDSLARTFDVGVPGEAFWKAVQEGTVRVSDLEELGSFCPCHLAGTGPEREALLDIFFDHSAHYGGDGTKRKSSLAMVLHMAGCLSGTVDAALDIDTFRAAVYSRTLPGARAWQPPSQLDDTARRWSYYVRNDILSVLMLEVFAIALQELSATISRPASIEVLAHRIAGRAEVLQDLDALGVRDFGSLCAELRNTAPALHQCEDSWHELAWVSALMERCRKNEERHQPALLAEIVRMLATLHIRDDLASPAYGSLTISADDLVDAPINLLTFRQRCKTWSAMPLAEVAADLVGWCLESHLRVALRKLREGSKDTFQFHPSERGLEWHMSIPRPSQTTPRFKQAVRILRDLAALDQSGPTDRGRVLMERVLG